jgi:hypothetical protein
MLEGLSFILSMLAFASAAGLLGAVLGMAHGIEVERSRKPRKRPPVLAEGEAMATEEELAG